MGFRDHRCLMLASAMISYMWEVSTQLEFYVSAQTYPKDAQRRLLSLFLACHGRLAY